MLGKSSAVRNTYNFACWSSVRIHFYRGFFWKIVKGGGGVQIIGVT